VILRAVDAEGKNEVAMRKSIALTTISLALLSACTRKPAIVTTIPPPPAPVAAPLAMPAGAYVGMKTPAVMSDGRYLTPNRNLSTDGTVWHLRAALNVAALACRGPDEDRIIAAYNALLTSRKAVLNTAQTRLSAEYKARGGDWQDRYDDQMTRLYNFFSQSQARDPFCRVAITTLADSAASTQMDFTAFAAERLPLLEKPFTDFYAAYDAWRAANPAASRPATASVAPSAPPSVQALPPAVTTKAKRVR
jgi:hypothetical protein